MKGLEEKLKGLPLSPGCYLFKDKEQQIIYIGKSKKLRNRVRQYFQNQENKEGKYRFLLREIADLQIIRTETETEALLLECMLVKHYQPRYNAQLRQTKKYPYIKINMADDYPSIYIAKEYEEDGNIYFGYFYHEEDAMECIELLGRLWQTPLCGRSSYSAVSRPCLNYQLKKCCGPCQQKVERTVYQEKIGQIIRCLQGNAKDMIHSLNQQMKAVVKLQDYEKAILCRDHIKELERLQKKNMRLDTMMDKRDIYMLLRGYGEIGCHLCFIREGQLKDSIRISDIDMKEQVTGFVRGMKRGDFTAGAHHAVVAKYLQQTKEMVRDTMEAYLAICLRDLHAWKVYIPVSPRVNEKMRFPGS